MTLTKTQFLVGPTVGPTGTVQDALRVGEDSCLITSEVHGRFAEAGVRAKIYSVATAQAGTTVVAANVGPPAAAAATILSLLNPVGSGINLSILQGWVTVMSGAQTLEGTWVWCGQTPGMLITAAEALAVKRSCFFGQSVSPVKAWSQTALTGGRAHDVVRMFPSTDIGQAFSGAMDHYYAVDDVAGALVVPPGGLITLAPGAVGSTTIVGAGIMYAEVPVPE